MPTFRVLACCKVAANHWSICCGVFMLWKAEKRIFDDIGVAKPHVKVCNVFRLQRSELYHGFVVGFHLPWSRQMLKVSRL